MADPTAATLISALSHHAEFKGFGELQELQVKVPCGLRWVRKEEVNVKMVTSTPLLARPSLKQLLIPFIWLATGLPRKHQVLVNHKIF